MLALQGAAALGKRRSRSLIANKQIGREVGDGSIDGLGSGAVMAEEPAAGKVTSGRRRGCLWRLVLRPRSRSL